MFLILTLGRQFFMGRPIPRGGEQPGPEAGGDSGCSQPDRGGDQLREAAGPGFEITLALLDLACCRFKRCFSWLVSTHEWIGLSIKIVHSQRLEICNWVLCGAARTGNLVSN